MINKLEMPLEQFSEAVAKENARLNNRIEQLEAALRSIAANTCCDTCQEAALVDRAALGEKKDG